jgi:hypothetical protein
MYLTSTFKLRTTRRKREIINLALSEYAKLRSWLFSQAEQNIGQLETEGQMKRKGRVYYSPQRLQSLLPPISKCPGSLHGGLKNAARRNVAEILHVYLTSKHLGHQPRFPSYATLDEDAYIAALEDLALSADVGSITWNRLVRRLYQAIEEPAKQRLELSSMNWLATNQGGLLLVNPSTQKYYALLLLLPRGHDLCERLETRGDLVPLGTKEREPFTKRPQTAVLCPLEFSAWQRDKFLSSEAIPRYGRLYRDKRDDYYLSVVFAMPDPEPVQLTGAAMAILGSASGFAVYTIVNREGQVLENGAYRDEASHLRSLKDEWTEKRKRRQRRGQSLTGFSLSKYTKDIVHLVANDLINKAVGYGARVVIQAPKRSRTRSTKKALQLQGYSVLPVTLLQEMVSYKAEMAGLPPAKWARMWRKGGRGDAWIYLGRVCSDCGFIVSKGEPEMVFSCPTCGDRDYVENLSKVVALSAIER